MGHKSFCITVRKNKLSNQKALNCRYQAAAEEILHINKCVINHKDVYVFESEILCSMLTLGYNFARFYYMSEGNISISASDKKFRVAIYSPTDWRAGMTRPAMVVELYPVFHRDSVSFNASIVGTGPEVIDGFDSGYVADKVMHAIKVELEAEGKISNEDRKRDMSWILSSTDGYIRTGCEYRAVVWFVTDVPGEISAVWIASTDSVGRDSTAVDEPKGHMYKV